MNDLKEKHENLWLTMLAVAVTHIGMGLSLVFMSEASVTRAFQNSIVVSIMPMNIWGLLSLMSGGVMVSGVVLGMQKLASVGIALGLFMAVAWTISYSIDSVEGKAVIAPWIFGFYAVAHFAMITEPWENPASVQQKRREEVEPKQR